jgi:hypothetical protein
MKSLLKSANSKLEVSRNGREISPAPVDHPEEAQCCAKVSKTVAGCHD